MKFGTQNLACLGQLQRKPSQVPVKIDPAGVITLPITPRVVWGWFDSKTVEVGPHVPAGCHFSAKCHMKRVSLVLENLGRGNWFLISVPIAFSSICSLSLCIPNSQLNQLTREAERSHHVLSGPAHCPARRCRFSSHFSMDKKLWTMWESSTNSPKHIQSWVTPL